MSPLEILKTAFLAGAADLERRAPLLNNINVFPVVDADTGTNMCQTLLSTVGRFRAHQLEHFSDLTGATARTLLKDARGNSGVIFSQFLVAFLESLAKSDRITTDLFADAAARGRDLAYRAVANPVQGTILTTMTDLARILRENPPFDSLEAHAELERALAASVACTPDLMPRLANAQVVDSGALGFHIFASGLCLALPAIENAPSSLAKIETRLAGQDEAFLGEIANSISPRFLESLTADDSQYRYCINLLIDHEGSLPDDWTSLFDSVGVSVDSVHYDNLIKLHLHGNDPRTARQNATRLGKVLEFTAEDMLETLSRAKPTATMLSPARLRVVGDSSMSLAAETARGLGISKIENYVCVQGEMIRDENLNREKLFARMRQGYLCTTAQTSAEEVRSFITQMLDVSEHLFYVAVGNAYTGTQALVRKVAAEHPEPDRIHVFDTGAASGQQGVICLAAARYAARANTPKEVSEYIDRQISICTEFLVIDDLKYLSRSGRIGRIRAAFAGALSLKPIVGHGGDGAITHAKVRRHPAAVDEILTRIASFPRRVSLLVLVEYTDNIEWAKQVANRLREDLPKETEIILSPLSSTSAVHMGPGTWGVAVTSV